jgi:hypothetical protein
MMLALLGKKPFVLEKIALIRSSPIGRLCTKILAWRRTRGIGAPSGLPSATNRTVPVGLPLLAVTLAVKATRWPAGMRPRSDVVKRNLVGGPTTPGAPMTYPPSNGAAIAVTGWGRTTFIGVGLHS